MTPQEKAKDLFNWAIKYGATDFVAIEFANKIVDEIINLEFEINCDASERCVNPVIKYYEQVKTEIEKL